MQSAFLFSHLAGTGAVFMGIGYAGGFVWHRDGDSTKQAPSFLSDGST